MKIEPLEFEKPIVDLENQLAEIRDRSVGHEFELDTDIQKIEAKLRKTKTSVYQKLTPWQRIQIARHPQRPFMLDYVEKSLDDFIELHGDRTIGDDEAMPGGFATLDSQKVVVVGHQKGRDTKENLRRNFGSAHPEGYRKAIRLMRMGEKFDAPIIALIDTPGAYPGIGAEERNIAEAIAYNLREMMLLKVPIIAVVIGEGGSGGALGIGVADRVLIMENAYYSIISPEGCAAILWKDRKYAPEAAEALKITANDLSEMGIVDEIIPEPLGGAHHDHVGAALSLKNVVRKHVSELQKIPNDELLEARYQKFRNFGEFKGA